MRKHVAWYLRGVRGAAQMREIINRMDDPQEVFEALRAFERSAEMG